MRSTDNYNRTKAMQEYASAILRELPMIDRVKNNEELDGAIYEMLQLLGKCSGADRVYIFDKKEKNRKEYFCLQYEWKNEDDILEKKKLACVRRCSSEYSHGKSPYVYASGKKS